MPSASDPSPFRVTPEPALFRMGGSPVPGGSMTMVETPEAQRARVLAEKLPLVTYTVPLAPPSQAVFVSPQMAALFGWSPEEFAREEDFWVQHIVPEDAERFAAAFDELRRTGEQ